MCPGIRTRWCACAPPWLRTTEPPAAGRAAAAAWDPLVTPYDRKDSLYRRAKREGYRSRAAYKLLELQRAQRVLKPGQRVADLGCWPGGWLQVAARAVGPKGRVVGIDRVAIDPLEYENTVALCGEIEQAETPARIRSALGGLADVVLCDAAPKLTGVRDADRAREEALLAAVEASLPELLAPGGVLVLKIFESPEAQAVVQRLRASFARAKVTGLRATRSGSSERYLLARGFRSRAARPQAERAARRSRAEAGEPGSARRAQARLGGDVSDRPFRILGVQQIAVGARDKGALRRLWIDLLGLQREGEFRSEAENVDEDIAVAGTGPLRVEVDLMQPIEPERRPRVHEPPLNHVGLWVDDLRAAVAWLEGRGVRFTPGGIRKGAAGHDVCFIHPKGTEEAPVGGEGVLIELVQAPPGVVAAYQRARESD